MDSNVSGTTMELPVDSNGPDSVHDVMFQVLYIIIPGFGLPGNLLAIIVMTSSAEIRRKPVNMFMIHQSVIDFCACLILMLTKMYDSIEITHSPTSQVVLCRIWVTNNAMWGVVFCSGNNLMFLTLERFWATKKPLQYNTDAVRRRLPGIFLIAWLLGIGAQLPKMSTSRIVGGRCVPYVDVHSDTIMSLMAPYYFSLSTAIPAAVMVYCYGSIGITLRKSASFQKSSEEQPQSIKMQRAQLNLLQTCVLLMVVFVLCWSVHAVGFILYTVGYFPSLNNDYYRVSLLFVILNSCLNPYIYSVRYQEFQDQLKVLFLCKSNQ